MFRTFNFLSRRLLNTGDQFSEQYNAVLELDKFASTASTAPKISHPRKEISSSRKNVLEDRGITLAQLDAVTAYFVHALNSKSSSQDIFAKESISKLNSENPTWQLQFLNDMTSLLIEEADKYSTYSSFTIDYDRVPQFVKQAAQKNKIPITLLYPTKGYISLQPDNRIMYDDLDTGTKCVKETANEFIKKVSDSETLFNLQLHNAIDAIAKSADSSNTDKDGFTNSGSPRF